MESPRNEWMARARDEHVARTCNERAYGVVRRRKQPADTGQHHAISERYSAPSAETRMAAILSPGATRKYSGTPAGR